MPFIPESTLDRSVAKLDLINLAKSLFGGWNKVYHFGGHRENPKTKADEIEERVNRANHFYKEFFGSDEIDPTLEKEIIIDTELDVARDFEAKDRCPVRSYFFETIQTEEGESTFEDYLSDNENISLQPINGRNYLLKDNGEPIGVVNGIASPLPGKREKLRETLGRISVAAMTAGHNTPYVFSDAAEHLDQVPKYTPTDEHPTLFRSRSGISKGKMAAAVILGALIVGGAAYAIYNYGHQGNEHTTSSTNPTNSTSSTHTTSSIQSPLPNATLYQDIQRNILNDQRISGNKTELTNLAAQLFLDQNLGTGQAKVLQPDGSYKSVYLHEPTIQALTNYSISDLPRHDRSTIAALGNMSEINPAGVDATPIVIPSANGNITIAVKDLPTFYWMLADQLSYSKYVLQHPELFEAINSKVRQEQLVYVDALGLNPTNSTVRSLEKANWDYHWSAAPQEGNSSKRITIFPWYNSTLMSQDFPNKLDRQLIERGMWLPIQLAQYDAKTGNVSSTPNLQAVKDNLGIIVNGSQWGSFNGTLYERIMKAWNNPNFKSYSSTGGPDSGYAWGYWNSRNGVDVGKIITDLKSQADEFSSYYKPLINQTEPIRKLAFAYGLNVLDQAVRGEPEQWDVSGAILYAKALGGAVFEGDISRIVDGKCWGTHQYVEIPMPQYLREKLPSDTIYQAGSVGLGSNDGANIQVGTPAIVTQLPNGNLVEKRYNSNC